VDRVSHQGVRLSGRPRQIAILVMLVLSFLVISVLAHEYTRFPGDLTLMLYIQAFDSGFVKQSMEVISQVGGGEVATILLLATALLFLVKHKLRESLLLIGAGLLSSADRLLKMLIDRPRPLPDLVSVIEINDSGSFPSGHATLAVVLFGALFYFSSIYISNPIVKRLAQIVAVAFILLTGISRIYLGAHWPSDVLGGYLLGCIIISILVFLHRRYRSVTN
jgi:membrane-associated phospholipid phosphatase